MLTWIVPKRNILYTTLLEGMTDVHAHLLPGVDGDQNNLIYKRYDEQKRVDIFYCRADGIYAD